MPPEKTAFAVRPARPEDAETIVRIQRAAVERAWRKVIPGDFEAFLHEKFDHSTQLAKYIERANDPARILLVVEKEGRLAGFGGARVHGPDDSPPGFDWQGNAFYLDPPYEGTGASVVLLNGLCEAVKARDGRRMVGWCLAGNRLARNFYEKRGGALVAGAVAPPEYDVAPHVAYGWAL
jgi:GNAT superfamily N-acetyltransferase